jgi:hypothetical protein
VVHGGGLENHCTWSWKASANFQDGGIVKLKAEPLMWPQDVGVISLPERQALGRDGPNSRQLDNAARRTPATTAFRSPTPVTVTHP